MYECNTKVAGEKDHKKQRSAHVVGRQVGVTVRRVHVEHHNTIYSCHFIKSGETEIIKQKNKPVLKS